LPVNAAALRGHAAAPAEEHGRGRVMSQIEKDFYTVTGRS
jgi:hypothetical protein